MRLPVRRSTCSAAATKSREHKISTGRAYSGRSAHANIIYMTLYTAGAGLDIGDEFTADRCHDI